MFGNRLRDKDGSILILGLPDRFIELLGDALFVFDLKNPAKVEFDKITNNVFGKGVSYRSSYNLEIETACQDATGFLKKKADFIFNKIKEIIQTIDIKDYAELNRDLKIQFHHHFNGARTYAKDYLDECKKTTGDAHGVIEKTKRDFLNIDLEICNEIDLFIEKYRVMKSEDKNTSTGITVTGIGNTVQLGDNNKQSVAPTEKDDTAKPTLIWTVRGVKVAIVFGIIGVVCWLVDHHNKQSSQIIVPANTNTTTIVPAPVNGSK